MGVYPMILVSILEGKNFPVRHDKKLIVEAKFDGEVMGTEPVPHVTFPQIQTEFGWEVDKKGLQMHRLQRTPIKLLWYAVDLELMRKESIGYIILDLRLAHETELAATWYPLLNCKYHREKPEVLIRLGLEKEANQKDPPAQKEVGFTGSRTYTVNELKDLRRQHSTDAIPKVQEKAPVTSLPATVSSNVLEPVLLPESCCYRIGPPELCHDNFAFSVTLAFAANLNKLAHPSIQCSSKNFYFYYSLFENDVMTGRFTSLLNPDFRAERASVKISSSADLLSSYFHQHSHLEVVLYCGDVPLASGNILVGSFASIKQHNIEKEPLCIEDNVKLHPIEKPSKLPTSEDLSPFVGVTVVLQKDTEQCTSEKPGSRVKGSEASLKGSAGSQSTLTSQRDNQQNSLKNVQNAEEINGNRMPLKEHNDAQSQTVQNHVKNQFQQQRTVNGINGSKGETSHIGYFAQSHAKNFATKTTQPSTGSFKNTSPWISNGNQIPHHPTNDNVPCHFCFSLDLCNFRATRLEHPVNVFIRYSYPFFGSSASVVTQPDVEVHPCTIINIPAGFCSFNFATTLGLLKSTFCESPLILEVVHRKTQGSKQEQLIGTSRINLFQIFNSTLTPYTDGKKQGTRQMCTCKVSVISPEGHEIGELNAIITLDDFGPSTPHCDKVLSKAKTPVLSQLRNSVSSFDVPSMRPNGFTQDELIQAAFEIELWKERQREIFRAELKEKEMQHLKILVTEWKQRDTEREVLLQRRLHECQKLEDKLKQMLQDAEIKEKQMDAQETELALRLQNIDKQQEQQEKEMTLQIEKLRMEYEDLLRIDRLKQLELEENISNLQRKMHEKDAEIRDQRATIESLRFQVNKQPDVELKTEVNILKMEKTELQEKFEAATASKQKYKLQWSQAVRQIAALQQKIRSLERLELSKKDEELANLQQRMLAAAEEKQKIASHEHNGVLSEITDKVNGLQLAGKQSDEQEQESPSSQSTSESVSTQNPSTSGVDPKAFNLHAQQLTAQREKLLKTGMYTESDAIIKTLNSYIEKAKMGSS